MKWMTCLSFLMLSSLSGMIHAQPGDNPIGQVIIIDTRFHHFVGNPIWTLIIRDIDHNQNIPYIFDLRNGHNHWVLPTYGRHYLISASNMQIESYQPCYNKYRNRRIRNFCNLESDGRIMKGESIKISIEGHLTPYSNDYTCHITTYPDDNFFIYKANT